jgi:uncharacterized protein YjbI with pentapeptide repeats
MAAADELNTSIAKRMEALVAREREVSGMEHVAVERARATASEIKDTAFKAAAAVQRKAEVAAAEQRAAASRQLEEATVAIKLKQTELSSIVEQHRADMERIKADRLAEHTEHVKKMQAAEAVTTARLNALEEQSEVKQRIIVAEHAAKMAERESRLEALATAETEFKDRLARVAAAVKGDGDQLVVLSVLGVTFSVTVSALAREPGSVLAALLVGRGEGPLRVVGDPSLFHLVVAYLLDGELPTVADVSQLQWLERQSKHYRLDKLMALCRDGYKRLNTVGVMQLLNGQRNLSGMDMHELDLSQIDFRGASFYRARLEGADLRRCCIAGRDTSLEFCDLSDARLDGALLSGVVAASAVFNGCSMTEVDASGASMKSASFVGANLIGASLAGATISNADATGANLDRVMMANTVATSAVFRGSSMSNIDASGALMQAATLVGANLIGASLAGATISNADATGANLDRVMMAKVVATSAVFKDCSMKKVDASGASMEGVSFVGANLTGASLAGATISNADATRARFDNARMENVVATRTVFTGCSMINIDASGARFDDADMTGVKCSGANFQKANLENANLSGSDLSDVDLTGANLSGAKLDNVSWPTGTVVNVRGLTVPQFSNSFGGKSVRHQARLGPYMSSVLATREDGCNAALTPVPWSQGIFWVCLNFGWVDGKQSSVGVLDVPAGTDPKVPCAVIPECEVNLVRDLGFTEGKQRGCQVVMTLASGLGKRTLTVLGVGTKRSKVVDVSCTSVVPYANVFTADNRDGSGRLCVVAVVNGGWWAGV